MAAFTLSKVKEEDFGEIVALEFKTFTDQMIRDTFMAPDTPEGHEVLRTKYIKYSKEDPNDHWVKVVDKANGRIIGASNWKICPAKIPDHAAYEDMSYPWLQDEPERLAVARKVMTGVLDSRKRLFTQPYVRKSLPSMV